jgi:hypothetical protein
MEVLQQKLDNKLDNPPVPVYFDLTCKRLNQNRQARFSALPSAKIER